MRRELVSTLPIHIQIARELCELGIEFSWISRELTTPAHKLKSEILTFLSELPTSDGEKNIFPAVLTRYAVLSEKNARNEYLSSLVHDPLGRWLKVNEIYAFLLGLATTREVLLVPEVRPEDHVYLKLVTEANWGAFFTSDKEVVLKKFWADYLHQIAEKVICAPDSLPALYKDMADQFIQDYRLEIKPIWPSDAKERVEASLSELMPQEEELLRQRFGIGQEQKELNVIAKEKGVPYKRLKSKYQTALRRLAHSVYAGRYIDPLLARFRVSRFERMSKIKEMERGAYHIKLDKEVYEFELSVRTVNCLESQNIRYLGELARKTPEEMSKIEHFGRKSLQEVKEVLSEMGLSLGMKLEEWEPPSNKSGKLEKSERKRLYLKLNTRIANLELSTRSRNCLSGDSLSYRSGCLSLEYVGELVQKQEDELLRVRNFGRRSLKEIKEVLAAMGLSLGMDVGEWEPPKDS